MGRLTANSHGQDAAANIPAARDGPVVWEMAATVL
jgi:hypothetical protein